MSQAAQACLHRVQRRIEELPTESQDRAKNLAEAITLFAKSQGAIGHVALNLATARMAAEVL